MLALKGMRAESPMFVRIFKEESEFEIWKAKDDGRYALFRAYPICAWSGGLGPKVREGDKQAPEGFYTVGPTQMNPNSLYHLSFNIGFPNLFDRANGHTGGALMVHGNCKSAGCYAMTDALIEEIYSLARESFQGGQREFQVQALPFRLTESNMARHRDNRWYGFWRSLKEGYDYFEFAHVPPKVAVCQKQYLVNVAFTGMDGKPDPAGACPTYAKVSPEPQPLHSSAPVMVAKIPTQPAPAVQAASVTPSVQPPSAPAVRPAQPPVVATVATRPAPPAPTAVAAQASRPHPAQPSQVAPSTASSQPVLASASPAPIPIQPQPRQRLEPVQSQGSNTANNGFISNTGVPSRQTPPPAQPKESRPAAPQLADQPGDTQGEQRVLKAGKSDKLGPAGPAAPGGDGQPNMFGYAPTER
jgi:murein L,D-transpeptidase YafK